jgi:hypothetical protein
MACGICENTFSAWRKHYPDLEPRIEAAREVARQTALEGIKAAGKKDWRALAEWLKLTFPEYRSGHNINVNATASAQQATVVCTDEHRQRLQERLRRLQEQQEREKQLPATAAPITLPEPKRQLQANVSVENTPSGAPMTGQPSMSPSMEALGFDLAIPESVSRG